MTATGVPEGCECMPNPSRKKRKPKTARKRATASRIRWLIVSNTNLLLPSNDLAILARRRCSLRRTATAPPMKTPQTKAPRVASCSQSMGVPVNLVVTSSSTVTVKTASNSPQSPMRARSTTSNASHLRWRSFCRTTEVP